MVTVIAIYRAKPDAAQSVAELLAEHAAASEREPGCRQFLAHQAAEDPARFFLYEVYDSEADFAAHRQSEHFKENVETKLAPLLLEREWHALGPALRLGPELLG